MDKPNNIEISREDLEDLKSRYSKCPDGGVFRFKGQDVLKSYAKYLIEYLEIQFRNPN